MQLVVCVFLLLFSFVNFLRTEQSGVLEGILFLNRYCQKEINRVKISDKGGDGGNHRTEVFVDKRNRTVRDVLFSVTHDS